MRMLKRQELARLRDLLDVLRHTTANARQLLQILSRLHKLCYRLGEPCDDLSGFAIGTHAKRVLALDIQQVSVCIECTGDLDVLHPGASLLPHMTALASSQSSSNLEGVAQPR